MSEQKDMFNFSDEDKREGESNFHNFVEFPELVGKLIGIAPARYGDCYTIETAEGVLINVGSYSALSSKITEEDIGKAVKIVYTGEKKSESGRMYKTFDVFIKPI